jgi:ribosomal protein S18 acetylase RimI-like enzyme
MRSSKSTKLPKVDKFVKPAPKAKLRLVNHGLTPKLWGIDWERHFPLALYSTGVTVEVSNAKEIFKFASENSSLIYGSPIKEIPFLIQSSGPARERYYEEAGDFFAFKKSGKTVGICVGNAHDWATYYIRNIAILPEFQGMALYQSLLKHLLKCLTDFKVARVDIDVAPTNFSHLHILNKFQFQISSLQCSERWGVLVRLTKFLDPKNKTVFEQQFCCGAKTKKSSQSG